MAQYAGIILTSKAMDMITTSQVNNTKLTITKVKIGDGELPSNTVIQEMTDIICPRLEAKFTSFESKGNGEIYVRFSVSNAQLEAGFFAREIGIFAEINGGEEILYAYTNAGSRCDWIPDKSIPLDSQVIDCHLVVGNTSNVTVKLSDVGEVLKIEMADHNNDPEAHPTLMGKIANNMCWAWDNDGNIVPVPPPTAKTRLATTADIERIFT